MKRAVAAGVGLLVLLLGLVLSADSRSAVKVQFFPELENRFVHWEDLSNSTRDTVMSLQGALNDQCRAAPVSPPIPLNLVTCSVNNPILLNPRGLAYDCGTLVLFPGSSIIDVDNRALSAIGYINNCTPFVLNEANDPDRPTPNTSRPLGNQILRTFGVIRQNATFILNALLPQHRYPLELMQGDQTLLTQDRRTLDNLLRDAIGAARLLRQSLEIFFNSAFLCLEALDPAERVFYQSCVRRMNVALFLTHRLQLDLAEIERQTQEIATRVNAIIGRNGQLSNESRFGTEFNGMKRDIIYLLEEVNRLYLLDPVCPVCE